MHLPSIDLEFLDTHMQGKNAHKWVTETRKNNKACDDTWAGR